MSVEIRELVIRAVVAERVDRAPAPSRAPSRERLSAGEFERLVDACVRRVMHLFRKSSER